MQKNYRIILFILLITFPLFSQKNETRNITFISFFDAKTSKENMVRIEYLIDIAEIGLSEKHANISLMDIDGEVDTSNLALINDFVYSNNIFAYYYITSKESDNTTDINLQLYNSIGMKVAEKSFYLPPPEKINPETIIPEELKNNWLKEILDTYNELGNKKGKRIGNKLLKNKISFDHDFPIFNISLTGVSGKLYFDERNVNFPHKIFSFFPIQLRMSFFPLKYLEAGAFFRLSNYNMVYKYKDEKGKILFFEPGIVFHYGFFAGASFFNETAHYSIGIEVYNLFYDVSNIQGWAKTDDYSNYFIPQISLYQKVDFKLFKILYYTIQFNFRTIPSFQLDNNYISYNSFFDFFVIELSIVGLSIMF